MLKRFLSASCFMSASVLSVGVTLGMLSQPVLAQETMRPVIANQDRASRIAMDASTDISADIDMSANKEALVREYLAVTQSNALAMQMMEPMIPVFQQAYPSVPPEFFESIMAEMAAGDLVEFLVPVFTKNLTVQELEAAIAFYRTPEGQSLLRKTPIIMQESQRAGALWGEQMGERILQELEAQGYLESRANFSEI